VIRLEHVTKTYPKASRPSLDDVTVGIEKGEFVFFIGPSARASRRSSSFCCMR